MCAYSMGVQSCMHVCAQVFVCKLSRPGDDVSPGCHFISHLLYPLYSSLFLQPPNLQKCY